MISAGWLIFWLVLFSSFSGVIGWMIRDLIQERRDDRVEEARWADLDRQRSAAPAVRRAATGGIKSGMKSEIE